MNLLVVFERAMKKNFKNILIVRTDRIGDVILTTPSIAALRKAYPEARISVLVSPGTRDLIAGNPYIDEVLVDDGKKAHRGLSGFLRLVTALKKKHFDLAVVFHTKKRTNLLCVLAGIPYRLGYKNDKLGFFLTHPVEDTRHRGEKHEAQYCLDLLNHLGIEAEEIEVHISLQKESEAWARQWLSQNHVAADDRLVAVHPGASDPSKRWPEACFADLIGRLLERYHGKVVLIGDTQIHETAGKILAKIPGVSMGHPGRVFDLTGQTSVSQLASLLKRCNLLISNDSGPVHVAAGVGTAVVSIFTRNQAGINPERWRPLGKKTRVISAPYNDKVSFAKAGNAPSHDSEMITTEQVLEAVDALFKLC